MAKPTIELIAALRETAKRLRNGAAYSWGHHGACNCGNLVQVVTQLSEDEVLAYAHEGIGEWTELAREFCPVTHLPINAIIAQLQQIGLTPTDIHQLEYLSSRKVLESLPGGFRYLKRNKRADAIEYFEQFANLLEEELLSSMTINVAALLPEKSRMAESTPA
jgi:hypothetical protein